MKRSIEIEKNNEPRGTQKSHGGIYTNLIKLNIKKIPVTFVYFGFFMYDVQRIRNNVGKDRNS